MRIKTLFGVYDITYYWDKAEVVKGKTSWLIELTYSNSPVMTIKCGEDEVQEVLNKLEDKE